MATASATLDFGFGRCEHGLRTVLQPGNFLQVVRLNSVQGVEGEKTGVHDGIGLCLFDPWDRREGVDGFGHLFLEPDLDLLLGVDVDLPTSQDAGEAGVLSATPDSE